MEHFKYCKCKSTKPQDKNVDESSEVVLGEVGSRCEEHERNVSLFFKTKCPVTLKNENEMYVKTKNVSLWW